MRLIVVRHGQTEANIKRICQGQTDGTLCQNGFEQAKQTALYLKNEKIDCCYSSDLKRALQTTDIIMKYHNNVSIIRDKRLRERYFGSFQGEVFPEIADDNSFPVETETPKDIEIRLKDFFNEITKKHSKQTLLLVTHGFTIRIIITIFMNIKAEDVEKIENIKNASISVVTENNGIFEIEKLNEISHLA